MRTGSRDTENLAMFTGTRLTLKTGICSRLFQWAIVDVDRPQQDREGAGFCGSPENSLSQTGRGLASQILSIRAIVRYARNRAMLRLPLPDDPA
jgi:hypothetical protein